MVTVKTAQNSLFRLLPAVVVLAFPACGQFHRVPPGHSLGVAMARRPVVLARPVSATVEREEEESGYGGGDFTGPSVEPMLPSLDFNDVPSDGIVVEDPAAYLVRGDQLREGGDTSGAILQYRDAVKLDPTFSLAWRNLALTYEELGDDENAMEAFRQYKKYAAE